MENHVDGIENMKRKIAGFQKSAHNKICEFRRDERGSLIIFSLFILILMLMTAGMAVDLMRAETQRARLQSTLDRAVLAGASLDQALDSESVVIDYFEKAGLSEFLTGVRVIPGDNSKTVEATAFMEVESYFLDELGINSLSAPASGTAEESLSNIEISLALDVSGSMSSWSASGERKLTDLIDAANEFVYLMQCNPDDTEVDEFGAPVCTVEPNTVSISLVPYSEQVLVGEDFIQRFNVTNEHTASSCADFETSDFTTTTISLTETLTRTGNHDARSSGESARDSYRTCRATHDFRKILPLSNDWVELQDQISTFDWGGYTSIDLAMKWAVGLLDPAIRPAVAAMSTGAGATIDSAFSDRPYDFNARSMQKVVVLMTDGINTEQYELRANYRDGMSDFWYNIDEDVLSVRQADGTFYYQHDDTYGHPVPYGDDWDGESYSLTDWERRCTGWGRRRSCSWVETTTEVYPEGSAGQMTYPEVWEKYSTRFYDSQPGMSNPVLLNEDNKDSRLNAICTAAKADGTDIEVFTIGFETSSASSAVMQSCASSEAHHFDANGLNLANAFTSIAREIHELRLTH